jgi:hypothetical protein
LCRCCTPYQTTSSAAFGGGGYTPSQLKAAFDRLPRLICERFNKLIDDVNNGEIAEGIPTGLSESHTLNEMFEDILDGSFAAYLSLGERSLLTEINELRARISALERR